MRCAHCLLGVLGFLLSGCAADSPTPTMSVATEAAPAALTPQADATSPTEAVSNNAAVPPNLLQRKLVYTAEVQLVVEDFEPLPAKVLELLKPWDAVVAHSRVLGSAGNRRSGDWTIRVPVAHYQDLLSAVRSLGELRSLQADSRDVTEEFYDVEARIRNKKEEESRMLKLLEERGGTLKEVLEIERELSRVREEVERMEGRMRVLQDLTALSTINLHIEEVKNYVPEKSPNFATQALRTLTRSANTLALAAQGLALALIALAPWVGVAVVVGGPLWGVYRLRRGRRARGEPRHS